MTPGGLAGASSGGCGADWRRTVTSNSAEQSSSRGVAQLCVAWIFARQSGSHCYRAMRRRCTCPASSEAVNRLRDQSSEIASCLTVSTDHANVPR